MSADQPSIQRIPGYCALCVARCGSVAVVENGRFVALEPDPAHPTGKALCAKGQAAPELVYHPDRLLYPLKRTRPKSDPDPDWQRIGWDEALDLAAAGLRRIAEEHGPESVVFSSASPYTFGQHGWRQAAPQIGAPGYGAFSPDRANYNLLIGSEAIDPISGSVPHRAYLCQVRRVD